MGSSEKLERLTLHDRRHIVWSVAEARKILIYLDASFQLTP